MVKVLHMLQFPMQSISKSGQSMVYAYASVHFINILYGMYIVIIAICIWFFVYFYCEYLMVENFWCHPCSACGEFLPVEVWVIFTARCYASAVLATALCPSVCPSVTSRCSTKTAKRRITQTTPHDSPGTLVSWRHRSPRNSTGVTPYGGTKCRWGGSKSATFDK